MIRLLTHSLDLAVNDTLYPTSSTPTRAIKPSHNHHVSKYFLPFESLKAPSSKYSTRESCNIPEFVDVVYAALTFQADSLLWT